MVVPLKLTQFYGHHVPRPRIYATVKYSDQRVDPPPSVNEALLSWASDAHWSMGGLSFKRCRTQGKVEGSVRRLRAFLEEDEDAAPVGFEKSKAVPTEGKTKPSKEASKVNPTAAKEAGKRVEKNRQNIEEVSVNITPARKQAASKTAEGAGKGKATAAKGLGKPPEKKRQRTEEESVEATPARNLRRKEVFEGSPAFVPATEEKLQNKTRSEFAEVVSEHDVRKKGLKFLSKADVPEVQHMSSMADSAERLREKLLSSNGKSLRGSRSPVLNGSLTTEASPASESGRSTRSGIKKPSREDTSVSPLQSSKGWPRARKILTRGNSASDEESSESDDGLEAFLKEKGRTPRRSSRLVKEQGNSLHVSVSDSDSESD